MRYLFLLLFISFAAPAFAADKAQPAPAAAAAAPQAAPKTYSPRIAALVNDEVISSLDVQSRMGLLFASTNIEDSDDNKKKLFPQILRSLIDEKLQMQEAKRLNITVTEGEVQAAIGRLAQQNNIPPENFAEMLQSRGLRYSDLITQIRSTIAWTKIVRQRFNTSAVVTEDEIEERLNQIKQNTSKPQYLLAEIFLPIESPDQEADVQALAEKLVMEVVNGANFASLAREFSQSASAEQGGDLGWVRADQLEQEVEQRLQNMTPNQISKALRLTDGYKIILLRDVRTPDSVTLPEKQEVAAELRQRKLESSARKYLRDLRSAALVDIRI